MDDEHSDRPVRACAANARLGLGYLCEASSNTLHFVRVIALSSGRSSAARLLGVRLSRRGP
jgi:hypothetical protein